MRLISPRRWASFVEPVASSLRANIAPPHIELVLGGSNALTRTRESNYNNLEISLLRKLAMKKTPGGGRAVIRMEWITTY